MDNWTKFNNYEIQMINGRTSIRAKSSLVSVIFLHNIRYQVSWRKYASLVLSIVWGASHKYCLHCETFLLKEPFVSFFSTAINVPVNFKV